MPSNPIRLLVIVPVVLALLASCASMRESTVLEPATSAAPASPAVEAPPLHATAQPTAAEAMIDSDTVPVGASPSLGRADALVTIVEFSDFQCPFCRLVQPTLRRVRELYGDSVRIVFKNAPLPHHVNAVPAAEAALEVYYQLGNDGFWQFHDLLFAGQRALARADLERYAEQLQVDMVRFRSSLDQRSHRDEVERDQSLAARLNIVGTPAFVINGTAMVGAQPFSQFVAVLDAVLERARAITPRELVYQSMVASPVPAPERPQPAQPAPPPTLDPTIRYRVSIDDAPVRGPADALVTIVEFTDFQCPYCGRVQPTLEALRQRYGNDLRLVFRNLPLEFHPNALPAAEAAREAFAQRGNAAFWRYHDLLFAHQGDVGGLDRAALEQYARQVGINPRRFASALAQSAHRTSIDRDKQQAASLGVEGTPNFFINGRRYEGARPEAEFIAAIDRELIDARAELARGTRRDRVYEALTAQGATAPTYLAGGRPPAPPRPLSRVAGAPTRGAAQGRVVIQILSDFQCPFCSRAVPTIEQVLRQYPNDVLIEWHDYPLPFHNNAALAAEGGREAMAQLGAAGFWRYHDLVFANQRALERADLERYAQQAGLDLARFQSALDQHTHAAAVRADVLAADATGASIGTPAFFINGHFLAGARPFADFARAIDAEIARPRQP